jgi:hypothetical protein
VREILPMVKEGDVQVGVKATRLAQGGNKRGRVESKVMEGENIAEVVAPKKGMMDRFKGMFA